MTFPARRLPRPPRSSVGSTSGLTTSVRSSVASLVASRSAASVSIRRFAARGLVGSLLVELTIVGHDHPKPDPRRCPAAFQHPRHHQLVGSAHRGTPTEPGYGGRPQLSGRRRKGRCPLAWLIVPVIEIIGLIIGILGDSSEPARRASGDPLLRGPAHSPTRGESLLLCERVQLSLRYASRAF